MSNREILEQVVTDPVAQQRTRVPNAIRTQWAALGWKAIDELRKRDFSKMSTSELVAIANAGSKYCLVPEFIVTPNIPGMRQSLEGKDDGKEEGDGS